MTIEWMDFAEQDEHPESERVIVPRMLLAEDDPGLRDALARIFRQDGYDVLGVGDGSEFYHLVEPMFTHEETWTPDVIVTDLRMPGLEALSVLEGLREIGWNHGLVIMSGHIDAHVRQRVARLDGFLFRKPFDVLAMEAAVIEATNR